MTNDKVFVPRKGLQRQLQYRALFDMVFYGIILSLFVTLWLLVGAYLRQGMEAVFEVAIYAFIAILLLMNLVPLYRPRQWRKAVFQVGPEELTIQNRNQEIKIPYSSIQKMAFFYSLSPNFSLRTSKGTYAISMFLERSEYVIEAVMAANPKVAPLKEVTKYRAVAVSQDHQFAFLRDVLPLWKKDLPQLILFAVVVVALSYAIAGFHFSWVGVRNLIWEMFYAVLSLFLLYMMTFGVMMSKVGQRSYQTIEANPQDLIRDTAYGQLLIRKSRKWQWFFGVLLCIFYASMVYIKLQL